MKQNLLRRWIVFICGVLVTTMGISLIITAGLGSSPVSSFAYALTFIFPGSLGLFSLLVNSSMLLGEILIQRREFPLLQLLQFPILFVFSGAIDLWHMIFQRLETDFYPGKLVILAAGCIVLGLGVALQVLSDVLILPAEGFVKVLAQKLNKEFGVVKTCYDVTMVAMAAGVSFLCLGQIAGLREGTVVTALVTGAISRFFRVRLGFLVREPEEAAAK